jgi:hypothetical protein
LNKKSKITSQIRRAKQQVKQKEWNNMSSKKSGATGRARGAEQVEQKEHSSKSSKKSIATKKSEAKGRTRGAQNNTKLLN